MRSLAVLASLILIAALALGLQSFFGSADDSSEQPAVENPCPILEPPDGKPPEQAAMRAVSSEAEEEIVRQIAQLLLEAQEEGRSVDEDPRLWGQLLLSVDVPLRFVGHFRLGDHGVTRTVLLMLESLLSTIPSIVSDAIERVLRWITRLRR